MNLREGRLSMTHRERRLARADRLRDWGETRERDGDAMRESARKMVEAIPLGEPVHGRADRTRREKSFARYGRAIEHGRKGEEMQARADEIERQAECAIYDDDPDAIDRLRDKLAALEAKRDGRKAANAEFRKANRAALKGMTAYDRNQAVPFPSYSMTNVTGNIGRTRDRITRLEREQTQGPRDRMITARFTSECAECGATIEKGVTIRYNRQQGARCASCSNETSETVS